MSFIIDNNNELFPNGTGSHLLWENRAVGASNSTTAGNAFQLDYIFDYMSTTSWFATGYNLSFNIQTVFVSPTVCNCVAFYGTGFRDAQVNSVVIRKHSDNSIIQEFDATEFPNNTPQMLLFDAVEDTGFIVEIITDNSLTMKITNMYIGRTIEFPCQPDVGYEPGKWNNERITKSFKTQNNAFGRSVTSERGTKEVANFSLLPMEFMDSDYRPFIQHHAGWPVFFAWDLINYPEETIFGQVQKGKSVFTTGVHSSVGLTFTGNIQ